MELLKQRILEQGKTVGNDVVKVDMFLNHQIDVELLNEIGKEFRRLFDSSDINKILTIEASGIGIACVAAPVFDYSGKVLGAVGCSGFVPEGKTEEVIQRLKHHVTEAADRISGLLGWKKEG